MADENDTNVTIKKEPTESHDEASSTAKPSTLTLDVKNFVASGIMSTSMKSRMGVNKNSSRLPSLRGPRDLTLTANIAGPSRPRIVMAPNVSVKRIKNDNVIISRSERGGKNRNSEKEKGKVKKERHQKEYVQTLGSLFGQGVASASKSWLNKRPGGSAGDGGGGGSRENYLQKPVLNPNGMKAIDQEHEERKLKELLRDDFIDDEGLGSFSNAGDHPVQLPIGQLAQIFRHEDEEKILKQTKALVIKDEVCDDNEMEVDDPKVLKKEKLSKNTKEETYSLADILTTTHDDLIFFQLPNSLPSLPPEVKDDSSSNAQNRNGRNAEETKHSDQCSTLHDLPEGQIGKFRIYESGKTELWLGDHKLIVEKGTQVGFLQDAVSVNVEDDENSHNNAMSVLGHVKHRLVVIPDFDNIVHNLL